MPDSSSMSVIEIIEADVASNGPQEWTRCYQNFVKMIPLLGVGAAKRSFAIARNQIPCERACTASRRTPSVGLIFQQSFVLRCEGHLTSGHRTESPGIASHQTLRLLTLTLTAPHTRSSSCTGGPFRTEVAAWRFVMRTSRFVQGRVFHLRRFWPADGMAVRWVDSLIGSGLRKRRSLG